MAFVKNGVFLPEPASVTSPSPHKVYSGYTTSTGENVSAGGISYSSHHEISDKQAMKAIGGLLRSWRTVGKVRVSAREIAESLSLSLEQVERVAPAIRGVRIGR